MLCELRSEYKATIITKWVLLALHEYVFSTDLVLLDHPPSALEA